MTAVPGEPFHGQQPLFVTWNTVRHGDDSILRGSIGTFEPQDLETGVPRFSPIRRKELPKLECGVTILSDFEPADHPLDWEIGIHGVKASFNYRGRRSSATFLPDVALEQGWDKPTTLRYLADKAGADEDAQITLTRYKGVKSVVSYKEYQEIIGKMVSID